MSEGKKFDKIDDALKFINDQLSLKGYYNNDKESVIALNGALDDNKLIINTFNKLLKDLNAKNEQLEELSVEKNTIKEKLNNTILFNNDTKVVEQIANGTHPNKIEKRNHVSKPTIISNTNNNPNIKKAYKVNLNKLQSTIDELRNSMHNNTLRKGNNDLKDLTWNLRSDITTFPTSTTEKSISEYIESSSVLTRYNQLTKLRLNLISFISMVNKLTYSKNILKINKLNITEENMDLLEDHLSVDLEVYELVNDYYEIIKLSNESV